MENVIFLLIQKAKKPIMALREEKVPLAYWALMALSIAMAVIGILFFALALIPVFQESLKIAFFIIGLAFLVLLLIPMAFFLYASLRHRPQSKIKKAKKIYREGNFPEKDSFWLQERLKPSKRKNHDLVFLFQGEWHHILVYSQTDQKNPYLLLPSYLLDGKKEYADVIGILTDSDLFDGKRIANVGKIIPVTYDGKRVD